MIDSQEETSEAEYQLSVGPECPFCHNKTDKINNSIVCAYCDIEGFHVIDGQGHTFGWRTVPNANLEVLWLRNETRVYKQQGNPASDWVFGYSATILPGFVSLKRLKDLKVFF
jgi:hypothetical protein